MIGELRSLRRDEKPFNGALIAVLRPFNVIMHENIMVAAGRFHSRLFSLIITYSHLFMG